jgi:hypothetical protein
MHEVGIVLVGSQLLTNFYRDSSSCYHKRCGHNNHINMATALQLQQRGEGSSARLPSSMDLTSGIRVLDQLHLFPMGFGFGVPKIFGTTFSLTLVGVTSLGTLMYGCNRVGTPVCGEVYEVFSCMKETVNHT